MVFTSRKMRIFQCYVLVYRRVSCFFGVTNWWVVCKSTTWSPPYPRSCAMDGPIHSYCTWGWGVFFWNPNTEPQEVAMDVYQVLPSDLFGCFKWPFQGLSDLHLGDQKVTWKKLVGIIKLAQKKVWILPEDSMSSKTAGDPRFCSTWRVNNGCLTITVRAANMLRLNDRSI